MALVKSSRPAPLRYAAILAVLLPVAYAEPASAQDGMLRPTLEELGVGYSSPGGAVELTFSGRMDFEAYAPTDEPAWLISDTSPFATGRLRLFADLFLGDAWYATAEFRVDGGEAPSSGVVEARMEQAFVRWTTSSAVFGLQAGKFVSPFGSYPSRHHTVADPFIRPPLHYEFRTMVSAREVPGNSAQFMQWKDADRIGHFRPIGAPPIWAAPYPWGGMAFGTAGRLHYRVALVNSAPSSEPFAWGLAENPMDRPSWVAAAGWSFSPYLRAELWYNRGPYLEDEILGPLPGDARLAHYDQVLWGGEVTFQRGYTTVRAEAVHDSWQVPNVVHDPVDVSYSIEVHQKLAAGWFAAGRFGAVEFLPFQYEGIQYDGTFTQGEGRWDHPARRVQLGAGWRPYRNAEIRAEYAWNWTTGPVESTGDLASLQLWWAF